MNETPSTGSSMVRGIPVVLVLHTPREKCWGILDEINPAGVFLRGLDLNAFDDWVSAVVHGRIRWIWRSVFSHVARQAYLEG